MAELRKLFTLTINSGSMHVCKSAGGVPTLVYVIGKRTAPAMSFTYAKSGNNIYIQVTKYFSAYLKNNFSKDIAEGKWVMIDGTCVKASVKAPQIEKFSTNSSSSVAGGSAISTSKKKTTTSNSSSSASNNNDDDAVAEGENDSGGVNSAEFDVTTGANAISLTASNSNASLIELMSKSMHGIFGIPYQWMDIADRRLDNSEFGRKYAEKIAARMPLLFLTPCRPSFLTGASKKDKDNIISAFWTSKDSTFSDASELFDALTGEDKNSVSKFYTANFAYDEYYRYVNAFCQTTAKLLHLDGSKGSPTYTYGVRLNGSDGGKSVQKLHRFNWAKALSGEFTDYFSAASAIPFYINANVSVNESFSNDTSVSALANTVKSKQDKAKELNYLLNTASAASSGGLVSDVTELKNSITSSLGDKTAASNFIGAVANSMASIAAGGSMMFPELWDSSTVGRSYQIDIKLRSPDGDTLSVYLNILVPLYHLLCLAAPQMMSNNYNVYYSPFIIKAYCKSMFNIDMGIITSMDISKGKEGDWNANGLPTSIDISITIKDLYDVFSITPYNEKLDLSVPLLSAITGKDTSSAKAIVRNTAMMDYICNNAGLNLNQNEVGRQITVYRLLRENNILNWPGNKWLKLQKKVDNTLAKLYSPMAKNR